MTWWIVFGIINVIICLADIYRQGFCKAIDLLSTLVMFIAGPFATTMVVLHYYTASINNVLERTIWRKHRTYNEILEESKRKHG